MSNASTATSAKTGSLTDEQAYEIGVEAYCYLYPLMIMDGTMNQMTNIPAGKMPLTKLFPKKPLWQPCNGFVLNWGLAFSRIGGIRGLTMAQFD